MPIGSVSATNTAKIPTTCSKNGLKAETVTETEVGEDGKSKEEDEVRLLTVLSVYARFFDESCRQWSKTPEYNLMFLQRPAGIL